jgi:hypothetical protein
MAKTAVEDIPRFKAPDVKKVSKEPKRITAFMIGETEYTALAEPSADIALTYMELATEEHPFAIIRANSYMMNALLGHDNYTELKHVLAQSDEGMEELGKLIEGMQRRMFATLDPKVKSPQKKPSDANSDG